MRFTIAVPSYNSEQYINELLDSLVAQTFDKEEFEVILVDDCSTDNTVNVVKKYQSKLNIKTHVLSENSGGPGKPRNIAISKANGEFIFFVDSDDYINKHTLEDVNKMLENVDTDVILVKMQGVNGRGVPKSMFTETVESVSISDSRIIYTLSPTKFYRTSLLKEKNIYFPEDLRSAEDQLFTMKAYLKSSNISILADKSYYYATKREGEHMSSAYVNPTDFYTIMKKIIQEIKNSSLTNKNEVIALFVDRHFNFSRTKNFSLKIKDNEVSLWMDSLYEFVNEIPVEIDNLITPSLIPLIKYARIKDFNNYQIVEKSYKDNQYENIKVEDSQILVQFIKNGQYFDISNLNKLEIKMTDFIFNQNEFRVNIKVLNSIINPGEMLSNVNLKLLSRNKKEKIIIPVCINDNNNFLFKCELDLFIQYGINEKIWDLFFEIQYNGFKIEKRIGKNRVDYKYQPEDSTIIYNNNKLYRFTPYFTKDFDNLSFYNTEIKYEDEFESSFESNQKIKLQSKSRVYLFEENIININYKNENILGYFTKTTNPYIYHIDLYSKVKKPIIKKNLDLLMCSNIINND